MRELVGGVWRHSVHTAVLAHALARSHTLINPDEAFLVGLLHEVGKLCILMRAQEHLEEIAADAAFQSVLAAWHPRIGRAVIEAWELAPRFFNRRHSRCNPPTRVVFRAPRRESLY